MLATIKQTASYILKKKGILFLILLGSLLMLFPFIFDGHTGCIHDSCGFIIGTNYRDGVWYQAVASTAFRTIPFRMPIFSGAELQGYHYVPNLLTYLLSLIGIPISFSYYQIFPIVFMALFILLGVYIARKIKDHIVFVSFFLFFLFFGMPLTLITSLYHEHKINNYLLINTFQSTRLLESPHTAFSFLILLAILIILLRKTISKRQYLFIGLLTFTAFGTKFYTALLIVCLLFLYETFTLIQTRNIKLYIIRGLFFISFSLFAVIVFFNPFAAGQTGSPFIFSPFATVHHLIETPNLFNLHDMVLARYFLYEHGWSPRLLAIELFSTFLFVIFYFGTRALGFIYILKQIITRKITKFELSITITIMISILFSVLFIQKGDWFNPIQFAVIGSFLMNIFVAKLLYELIIQKKLFYIVCVVIILLITFPANLVNLTYLSHPARYVIPQKEMEALAVLKNQPDGAVFAPITDSDLAYVSAFTGKPTYVNFLNVLENTSIPFEKRLKEVSDIEHIDIDALDVSYIYLPGGYEKYDRLRQKVASSKKFKLLYKNSQASIFINRLDNK